MYFPLLIKIVIMLHTLVPLLALESPLISRLALLFALLQSQLCLQLLFSHLDDLLRMLQFGSDLFALSCTIMTPFYNKIS